MVRCKCFCFSSSTEPILNTQVHRSVGRILVCVSSMTKFLNMMDVIAMVVKWLVYIAIITRKTTTHPFPSSGLGPGFMTNFTEYLFVGVFLPMQNIIFIRISGCILRGVWCRHSNRCLYHLLVVLSSVPTSLGNKEVSCHFTQLFQDSLN